MTDLPVLRDGLELAADVNGAGLAHEWIAELSKRWWNVECFPNSDCPRIRIGVFWPVAGVVDVVQTYHDLYGLAYRAPVLPGGNPLTPASVVWAYGFVDVVWAIRAALALPAPGAIDAPAKLTPTPPVCQALPELLDLI